MFLLAGICVDSTSDKVGIGNRVYSVQSTCSCGFENVFPFMKCYQVGVLLHFGVCPQVSLFAALSAGKCSGLTAC